MFVTLLSVIIISALHSKSVIIDAKDCGIIVKDGTIINENNFTCVLHNNGQELTMKSDSISNNLHYGLIVVNCPKCNTNLISKMGCKNCGLYCKENDYIRGCENYIAPYLIGAMVGLILSLIISIILMASCKRMLVKAVEWYEYKKTKDAIYRENLSAIEMSEKTGIDIKTNYKYRERNFPDTIKTKLESIKIEDTSKDTRFGMKAKFHKKRNICYRLLMLILCFKTAHTCDKNLYISSEGKICDINGCTNTHTQSLALMSGSTVCFKDYEGEKMEIKISNAYKRSRFNLIYKTSDYDVEVRSYDRCFGGDDHCWKGGCKMGDAHPRLKSYVDGKIHDFTCSLEREMCDSFCFHRLSCVYGVWWLKEVGDKAGVYEFDSSIWEVIITVKYRGKIMNYHANVNNPRINLDHETIDLPLYVTGFHSGKLKTIDYIMVDKGVAYVVDAASLNMPVDGLIGDYQVELYGNNSIFNTNTISCKSTLCVYTCKSQEPTLRRFRKIKNNNSISYISTGSDYIIETKQQLQGIVNLMIGDLDVNSLYVEKSICDLTVSMEYACTGCNTFPYIVIQATNIKSEGLIPVTSNCTMIKPYLSCGPDPYKFEFITDAKMCAIRVESMNMTIMANFNYVFKGELNPMTSIYTTDKSTDIITDLIKSDGFFKGITQTLGMFSLLTIGLTFITAIIKAWQLRRFTESNTK